MTRLWVGCFGDNALHEFEVHDTTLRPERTVALSSPAWLTPGPTGLLAALHLDDSALAAVELRASELGASEEQPPKVQPSEVVDVVHTGEADACHVATSPDGAWAAVAHYTSGSVSVFGTGSEGGGLRLVDTLRFGGASHSDPERQESPHAHHTAWVDDEHLLVCDLGADVIRVVLWQAGQAVELDPIVCPAGFGPRHLVLRDLEGRTQVAVAGELSGDVACFEFTGDWGQGWVEVSRCSGTLVGGSAPSGLRALTATRLVLANRFIDTLAFLDWDEEGTLCLLDEVDSGGSHARDLVVRDGRIWVAHQHSDEVTVLADVAGQWRVVDRNPVARPAALLFVD